MQDNIQDKKLKLKMHLNNEVYCNVNEILSYNAFMNVIMGGRGKGKTTQFNIWALMRYNNYGEQFIYLRRYKSHTKKLKNLLDSYIENKVEYVGLGEGSGMWKVNKDIVGFLIPLSQQGQFKSGIDFTRVSTIIYDEAIIKKTSTERYLQEEITYLLEFISTVMRTRTNLRVIILGNNLDFFNPYCLYFNVSLFERTYYNKERSLLITYIKGSEDLRLMEEKTPLYALTKGTPYHSYHYENDVLKKEEVEISSLRNNDKCRLSLKINEFVLNFYLRDNNRYLIKTMNKGYSSQGIVPIIENNQVNFYGVDYFKSRWLKYIQYLYSMKLLDYADENANVLLLMLFDIY